MDKKNRRCVVCQSEYHFCPRCAEDKNKPLFYFTFCSKNCRDIYDTTSKFENNQIDIKAAKDQLDELDLSKLNDFGNSYKLSIKKINELSSTVTLVEDSPVNIGDDILNMNEEKVVYKKTRVKKVNNNEEQDNLNE